jgi:hypothetical protein
VLLRFTEALDAPQYNFVIHSSTIQEPAALDLYWHIEIIPKIVSG